MPPSVAEAMRVLSEAVDRLDKPQKLQGEVALAALTQHVDPIILQAGRYLKLCFSSCPLPERQPRKGAE